MSSNRQLEVGMFLPVGGAGMMGGEDASYSDLLEMTLLAQESGLDFVCVLDHFNGHWEGWTTLSALAASTSTIKIASYVSCTGYRNPALLAKMADTVDEISGGRLILGLGAGDDPDEHRMFGYPTDRLVSRFEEATSIVHTLLHDGQADFQGEFYQVNNCELRPRGPSPSGPPILIGSLGGPRMMRITAQYADIAVLTTPVTHNTLDGIAKMNQSFDEICAKVGRDPSSLRRLAEVLIEFEPGRTAAWTESKPVTGSPTQIAEMLQSVSELGVTMINVWLEPNNLAGIEQFALVLEELRQ